MNDRIFLTAMWKNIIHLNYAVDDDIIEKLLPKGTQPDKFQNKSWVSLVAFEFEDTKVKGIPIPVYGNFPEINLRYYAKNDLGKRAVVFVREFIPRTAISYAANLIYNEHYKTIEIDSNCGKKYDFRSFKFNFSVDGKKYFIEAETEDQPFTPIDQSSEHFFKQRDAGFGVHKDGSTMYYDLEHEKWRIYENRDLKMDIDFGEAFGEQWKFLNEKKKPDNWFVAEGGNVKVYDHIRVTMP